jgi:hypothetical protein
MKVRDYDEYMEELEVRLYEAYHAVRKIRIEESPTCKECPDRTRTFASPPCKECEIQGSESREGPDGV